jgi:tetratricopeptide (TPR) repeat protein
MAKKKYKSVHKNKKRKRKASRANKKLITILVSAIIVVGGVLAAMLYVNLKSAGRNVSNGDAYVAEGEFDKAYKLYGRAVSKEPNNLSYIQKLQDTVLMMTPVTVEEAFVLYNSYLTTLVHTARYNPIDIDVHLEVADELYRVANITSDISYWQRLQTTAESGLSKISQDDPRRFELVLYVGLSKLKLQDKTMTETYDDVGNVRFPGEDEIELVLQSDPGNARAWAALAHGRMAIYYRLESEGKTSQAEVNRLLADETMQKAEVAAGESFDVLSTRFRELVLSRLRLHKQHTTSQRGVPQEELDQADEEVAQLQRELVDAFSPEKHGMFSREIASLLIASRGEGNNRAAELLKKQMEFSPNDSTSQYLLATVLKNIEEFEGAETIAKDILDSPQQTVQFESAMQFSVRPQAAHFLVDLLAMQALSPKNKEDKPALLARASEYREVLADFVSNNPNNILLLSADGIIALAEENYEAAASKLEEVISRDPAATGQLLEQVAKALAESGSKGLAIARLGEAVAKEPGQSIHYINKARLEIEIADFEAAKYTLSLMPKPLQSQEVVLELLDIIALKDPNAQGTMFSDPILAVIAQAERAVSVGEFEKAVSLLTEKNEETGLADCRLSAALSNVYREEGDKENAIAWMTKSLDLDPESITLQRALIVLQSEDRIASIIQLIESGTESEAMKAEQIASSLFSFGIEMQKESDRWEQFGNLVSATEATNLSEKAFAESEKYQQIAEDFGADLSGIIQLQINQAMIAKEVEKTQGFINQLLEIPNHEADAMGFEVRLSLLQASESKGEGKQSAQEVHLGKALELAKKLTEKMPFSDKSWRTLGLAYSSMGSTLEALAANEEAYRISPKSMVNIRAYVGSLLRTKSDTTRLLRVIRLARTQFPNDIQILELWLNIEMDYGKQEAAFVHRRNQYLRDPSDRLNAIVLASIYVNAKPTREMMLNPDGSPVYTLRAWNKLPTPEKNQQFLKANKQWKLNADEILDLLAKEVDQDILTCGMHCAVLRDRGKLSDASKNWDMFIEKQQGTGNYSKAVIAAADFFRASERNAQAMTLLENAREFQSENFEIDATLGTLHYLQREYEEAAEVLGKPIEATGNRILQIQRIESLALSGQFDDAEKALGSLPQEDDALSVTMLKALITRVRSEQLLTQGDFAAASIELKHYRNALNAAIEIDPTNQMPRFRLCKSLLNEYRLTQNKDLLEEALVVADEGEKETGNSAQFAVIRADVLQADGQLDRAIDRLALFLSENPESNVVRQRLVEAYLDIDNVTRAITVAEQGVTINPSRSFWHRQLGDLYVRANDDRKEAVIAYIAALEREPSVSLLHLIDEMTRTEQPLPDAEILAMARGAVSKMHPVVNSLEAKALQNLGQDRESIKAMERSWSAYKTAINNGWIEPLSIIVWFRDLHALFSDNPEDGVQLARRLAADNYTTEQQIGLAYYYKEFGGDYIDKSLQVIDEALKGSNTSDNSRVHLLNMRGGLLVEQGKFEESKIVFQKLVDELHSPVVLNNYAYVVGVYMNEPEEGLKLALQAIRQAPRNPSVLDTVSVLYERTDNYEKAVEMLDFLLQVDPSNAKAMARLGILYSDQLGQPERGVVFAERARSLSPRLPEVLDALGWSYYQTGQEEKAEDYLKRSIRQDETMDAYVHLAQLVMKRGDYDKALDYLRMAQELAKDPYSTNRITALQDDIRNNQVVVPE